MHNQQYIKLLTPIRVFEKLEVSIMFLYVTSFLLQFKHAANRPTDKVYSLKFDAVPLTIKSGLQ